MDKEKELKIIKEMQAIANQMRKDDLEENPDSEFEFFECDCCNEDKPLAGSIGYGEKRLCNDCVLYAETGFALGKFKTIDDLLAATEERRLENICEFIKHDISKHNN